METAPYKQRPNVSEAVGSLGMPMQVHAAAPLDDGHRGSNA